MCGGGGYCSKYTFEINAGNTPWNYENQVTK